MISSGKESLYYHVNCCTPIIVGLRHCGPGSDRQSDTLVKLRGDTLVLKWGNLDQTKFMLLLRFCMHNYLCVINIGVKANILAFQLIYITYFSNKEVMWRRGWDMTT